MTHVDSAATQRLLWIRIALVGGVIVSLGISFFLLERQREDQLLSETLKTAESIDGEVVAVTFLEPTVTARQLRFIRRYPKLRRLVFSSTSSLEGRLESLRAIAELKTIDLSSVGWLDETAMSDIAGLPQVSNLLLGESTISDSQLSRLAAHPGLTNLSMRGCRRISDHSIDTLVSLPALKQLDLDRTGISLEGFARLRTARQELTISYSPDPRTTGINLSTWSPGPFVQRQGLSAIASSAPTADLIAVLTTPHDWSTGAWTTEVSLQGVYRIELSGPSATASMAWLAPRLLQLEYITTPAAALSELNASHVAEVRGAVLTDVTSADQLAHLASMPLLDSLSIEVTAPLEADVLPVMGEMPHPGYISLAGPGVNDAAVRLVSRIAGPDTLQLHLTLPLSPEVLQDPGEWRHLERIRLSGPGVSEPVVGALSQIDGLRSLDLELSTPLDGGVLQPLSRLPQLKYISLRGPGVSDPLVASLADWSTLESLTVAEAPVGDPAFVPFLSESPAPRIHVYQTGVSPQMLQRLQETMTRR